MNLRQYEPQVTLTHYAYPQIMDSGHIVLNSVETLFVKAILALGFEKETLLLVPVFASYSETPLTQTTLYSIRLDIVA
jgi:hypothetical protein